MNRYPAVLTVRQAQAALKERLDFDIAPTTLRRYAHTGKAGGFVGATTGRLLFRTADLLREFRAGA